MEMLDTTALQPAIPLQTAAATGQAVTQAAVEVNPDHNTGLAHTPAAAAPGAVAEQEPGVRRREQGI